MKAIYKGLLLIISLFTGSGCRGDYLSQTAQEILEVKQELKNALASYAQASTRFGQNSNEKNQKSLKASKETVDEVFEHYQNILSSLIGRLKRNVLSKPEILEDLSPESQATLKSIFDTLESSGQKTVNLGRGLGSAIGATLIGLPVASLLIAGTPVVAATLGIAEISAALLGAGSLITATGLGGILGGMLGATKASQTMQAKEAVSALEPILSKIASTESLLKERIQMQQALLQGFGGQQQ